MLRASDWVHKIGQQKGLLRLNGEYPDTDGDGVKDNLDLCPDTPAGALVDVNGCELFNLPSDTFSVIVTSANCVESETGIIRVEAENTSYTYTVLVSGEVTFELNQENSYSAEVTGLIAGSYEVCITVDGNDLYQQCYTVQVEEPEPLSASSKVNYSDKSVSLSLSGSKEYIVSVNGKERVTDEAEVTLDLEPGMNYIEVRTDLECQGTYFEQIFVSESVRVYPNPTVDWAQVYVGGTDKTVSMNLVDLNGNRLQQASMDVPATREIELNLSGYPVGVYVIQLEGKTVKTSIKVIKK